MHRVRNEFVVRVTGKVRHRPEGTVNDTLPTGEVEVAATTLEVLNEAETPPFPVDDRIEADEMLRLRHRYVDLRRPRLQRNLRVRAEVNAALRRSLDAQGFTEVETPMLIASTPEGARDFVVPSRLSPGEFYALPQSPQLFKQLLMVGGLDRYYQIARCLRDEDLRADRQFEFMQLDAEMSFADADDVMGVIGEAVLDAAEAVTGTRPGPVSRMTWHQAQEHYGSDKPDVRFGLELVDLGRGVRRHRVPRLPGRRGEGHPAARRGRDVACARSTSWSTGPSSSAPAAWCGCGSSTAASSSAGAEVPVRGRAARHRRHPRRRSPATCCSSRPARVAMVDHVLGTLRVELGRPPVHEGGLQFLWVVDFPLFEALDDDGRPIPAHHPFTMPHPDDVELLEHGKGEDLLGGAVAGLRPRAQRLGARLGFGANPPSRPAAADLLPARHLRGGGAVALRLPARRVPLRRAAARRASRSASTGSPRSWPARTTSARSSRSPRPSRAPTRSPARPPPIDPAQLKELGLIGPPQAQEVARRTPSFRRTLRQKLRRSSANAPPKSVAQGWMRWCGSPGTKRPAQVRSAGRGRLRQGGAIGRVRVGRPHVACL